MYDEANSLLVHEAKLDVNTNICMSLYMSATCVLHACIHVTADVRNQRLCPYAERRVNSTSSSLEGSGEQMEEGFYLIWDAACMCSMTFSDLEF